jgi:hypothetical protein
MTSIDGKRQPGTIPGLAPGALLDRIDELARLLHCSPMEVVVLAFADYTPAIETKAGNRVVWPDHDGNPSTPRRITTPIPCPWFCTAHVNGVACGRHAVVEVHMRDDLYWSGHAACDLHVPKIAPPVDAGNMTPGSPGDERGAGGVAATPAPVSHAAPAHVHLGGGPCVYGERCGQ